MTLEAIGDRQYDVAITTCGYELRASHVAKQIKPVPAHFVLDYSCTGHHSYDKNRASYEKLAGAQFLDINDAKLREHLAQRLQIAFENAGEQGLSILVDVSSCSRRVMAATFLALSDAAQTPCNLTIAYALSVFEGAPEGELPSSISEPVIGDLSGWSDDLSKPPCAVIGLGFEPGRALGSLDYLEVPEVRLFMPHGPDQRFDEAVRAANKLLIDEAGSDLVFPYNVMQPNATYDKLHSLILGLRAEFRPVLIPLGPKIFSAICIIIAIKFFPLVCVWRTSSGDHDVSGDKIPSGEVALFDIRFGGAMRLGQLRPSTPFSL